MRGFLSPYWADWWDPGLKLGLLVMEGGSQGSNRAGEEEFGEGVSGKRLGVI